MSQLNRISYKNLYGSSGTTFPDNTSGQISEGDMRQFGEDQADSFLMKSSDLIDDDTLATASPTTVPSSESVKAYVDTQISSSSSVQRAEINLTNLQVRALASSPATVVSAQGANTFIELVSGYYIHTYGTVAFNHASGTGFTFTAGGIAQSSGVGESVLTNATHNRVQRWNASNIAIKNNTQDGINQPLLFAYTGGGAADATTGDGTGKIVVYYRVVDLS